MPGKVRDLGQGWNGFSRRRDLPGLKIWQVFLGQSSRRGDRAEAFERPAIAFGVEPAEPSPSVAAGFDDAVGFGLPDRVAVFPASRHGMNPKTLAGARIPEVQRAFGSRREQACSVNGKGAALHVPPMALDDAYRLAAVRVPQVQGPVLAH